MFLDILYLFLSLLALSLLIFIHELGHYWVAKREGFDIEVFSIGFGKPIYQWEWQGVKWQICYCIFGGYVKIKGMYRDADDKPSTFKGSFYDKTPWQRIKVALAGPLANFALALVIFAFIWQFGGIEKPFSEFTRYLGWLSPKSEMYQEGIRPGDRVISYDDYLVKRSEDHLYGAMLGEEEGVHVKGEKWDQGTQSYLPFDKVLKPFEDTRLVGTAGEGMKTLGVLSPANMLIFDRFEGSNLEPMLEGSPMKGTGLSYGDRLIWLDGHFIFSSVQLRHLLNDNHALITVLREGELILTRIPKFTIFDYKLSPELRSDFEDMAFDVSNTQKAGNFLFVPYEVEHTGLVLGRLELNTKELFTKAFNQYPLSLSLPEVLHRGDRIVAVDGIRVKGASEIFEQLQQKRILAIVQRDKDALKKLSWTQADQAMEFNTVFPNVQALVAQIGVKDEAAFERQKGNIHMLQAFSPKQIKDFPSVRSRVMVDSPNPQEVLASEDYAKNVLGIHFQDRQVNYNPDPITACKEVANQIFRTLKSLFMGDISPKWLGGAVGMVHYMQVTLAHWGLDDALYWVAVISVNLGILNLMPIPVLDGGYIVLSFIEMFRGKPLNAKTLDYILLPFVFLIISLFVYTTFNDLIRLFF